VQVDDNSWLQQVRMYERIMLPAQQGVQLQATRVHDRLPYAYDDYAATKSDACYGTMVMGKESKYARDKWKGR